MGRGLVALVVLLALSGCAVVAAPEPGFSDAERNLVRQSASDGWWESSGLPDELRPAAVPVAVVGADEWPTLFVGCMNGLGFDNYRVRTGQVVISEYDGTDLVAAMLAHYTCRMSYWTDAGRYNADEMDYLYDYYEQTLVPCLTVHDLELIDVPSRQDFVDGWFGRWNPYDSVHESDRDWALSDEGTLRDCPRMPPGIEEEG